jgi:catechol 2,3-dioxygenase-like lactoylglutathione lyase family enzyme
MSAADKHSTEHVKFGYTILYVPDVPATLKFYQDAFGLATRFLHEGGDYGELETGSTALAFSNYALMKTLGKNPQPATASAPVFEIALTTPDVAAALERALAAGAVQVRPVETMPWGQTIAYVSDVNGFLVELCTPIGGSS